MTDLGTDDLTGWGCYLLWDPQGGCLYVGKGSDGAEDRRGDHARKPWGHRIHRWDWLPVDTEAEALDLERKLIRSLAPEFNIQHNMGRGKDPMVATVTPTQPPSIWWAAVVAAHWAPWVGLALSIGFAVAVAVAFL